MPIFMNNYMNNDDYFQGPTIEDGVSQAPTYFGALKGHFDQLFSNTTVDSKR